MTDFLQRLGQLALATVLCRCGTHTRMLKAIKRYAKEVRA